MKKVTIFYLIDFVWIVVFAVLSFMENKSKDIGLGALESLGRFYLFLGLCILGVVALIVVLISKKIIKKSK